MKRFAVALLAFAASGATAALAADMTAPVYKTSPAPNWTGFYLGINAGGGIAIGEFLDFDVTAADLKINDPSATVGGQFGYNWQWRAMVLGLEGDYNWNSANKTLPYGENDAGCNTEQCPATFKMDAYASIRGRMGLAYDNGLVYVTAGPGIWPLQLKRQPGSGNDQLWISLLRYGSRLAYRNCRRYRLGVHADKQPDASRRGAVSAVPGRQRPVSAGRRRRVSLWQQ